MLARCLFFKGISPKHVEMLWDGTKRMAKGEAPGRSSKAQSQAAGPGRGLARNRGSGVVPVEERELTTRDRSI